MDFSGLSFFSKLFLVGALHVTPPALVPVTVVPVTAPTIRVLSLNFNAETVPADNKTSLRDARFRAFLDWARVNDPDVILLQEGWNYGDDSSVALTLARALGFDVAYHLDMGAPGVLYDSVAVLAKKKFHMTAEHDILLPHSAFHVGNGKSWILITGAVSYGVGARLTLENGDPLYVYTSHLVGSTDDDRADQMRALSQAIRAHVESDGGSWGKPDVLVGGDLNSRPGSPLDLFAHQEGYRDVWEQTHFGEAGNTDCSDETNECFNPLQLGGDLLPDQSAENSSQRIDHIYALGDGLRAAASTEVFTTPFDGVWMSDHYGLLATYAVGDGPLPAVPNPARDFARPLLPTKILDITAQDFYCDGPSIDRVCERSLAPFYVVGPKGLTIRNVKGAGLLDVRIEGPGPVYSSSHATLDSSQRASFVFAKDGDYTYRITDSFKNVVDGTIHVVAEAFVSGPPPVVPRLAGE